MRRVFLFMMVSLDGYFEGPDHDLSWHNVDDEFNEFAVKQLKEADTILFGRLTYQLMESYWPSRAGLEDDPVVAKLMNETQKIVFSRNLDKIVETDIWKNVTLFNKNVREEVIELKQKEGKNIVVLGSSNLCVTLLEEGLLDEIRLMINPVAIGKGTPLFSGIKVRQKFQLKTSKNFQNGNVLLTYNVLKGGDLV